MQIMQKAYFLEYLLFDRRRRMQPQRPSAGACLLSLPAGTSGFGASRVLSLTNFNSSLLFYSYIFTCYSLLLSFSLGRVDSCAQ